MRKIPKEELLAHEWPMALAHDFSGGCPCGEILGEDYKVEFHCWRVPCDSCEFSGIHVSGGLSDEEKLKIGEHIRDNNGWTDSADWNILIE